MIVLDQFMSSSVYTRYVALLGISGEFVVRTCASSELPNMPFDPPSPLARVLPFEGRPAKVDLDLVSPLYTNSSKDIVLLSWQVHACESGWERMPVVRVKNAP